MAEVNPTSPPHLTPPLTEEELLDWLCLLRSRRVGIATFFRLMRDHGSAAAALEALPGIARDAGVDDYAPCPRGVAEAEVARGWQAGARAICFGAQDYPPGLLDLDDPPPILWTIGDIALTRRPMAALVGARNASSLGTRMARKLARDLGAQGIAIVSGLARGVDTAAHVESLPTGTVAVLAGGVDVVYPAENAALAQEITEQGLRLTEQPMGLQPQARHFPRRNRLISGLSRAVVVVEAAAKSGSLITARTALDQGRDVFAVPGHPFDARAAGCNMLIRDGAMLARSAADVLEMLRLGAPEAPAVGDRIDESHVEAAVPPPTQTTAPVRQVAPDRDAEPSPPRPFAEVADLHARILSRLGPSPVAEDDLIRDLSTTAAVAGPEIVTLELEGKIRRDPGGRLSRVV